MVGSMTIVEQVAAALVRLDLAADLGAIVARGDRAAPLGRSDGDGYRLDRRGRPTPVGHNPATGLPTAVQIAAPQWHDHVVLAIAQWLEACEPVRELEARRARVPR